MKRRSTIFAAVATLLALAPASPPAAAEPPWVQAEDAAMTPLGLRAGELDGATLYGEDGEALGEIEKVLATREGGMVAGLAVEIAGSGGVLGIGERTVILRFDQVRRVGDRVATLLSRAQLGAQPRWDD